MKKILIVDDSAFTRDIHRQIVESMGFASVEASNGEEAIEVFSKETPDLTMVDLLMPGMDGIDVVKALIALKNDAKIVVCSTDKQKFRQEDARRAGAAAFLTKPVDAEKVVDTLNKLL